MQEEKWYFLQPELPPIPEQQMEVHNRIEPLRGFLHLWPTPWTFSFFFLQWQSLSSWSSSTGLLELMCRCPLSPLKPTTRHVDPPGSAEIPDPEGRGKNPGIESPGETGNRLGFLTFDHECVSRTTLTRFRSQAFAEGKIGEKRRPLQATQWVLCLTLSPPNEKWQLDSWKLSAGERVDVWRLVKDVTPPSVPGAVYTNTGFFDTACFSTRFGFSSTF